ncbi:hypothetical protein D6C97_06669 [Aureobasidium pullulans]|nr:hypothetical protein D6C97_06669 [Aureobasidium pullulans]
MSTHSQPSILLYINILQREKTVIQRLFFKDRKQICEQILTGANEKLDIKMANPHDYNAIRNAISLYCIALDTKDWPLLEKVFTKDVFAQYPFNDEPILGYVDELVCVEGDAAEMEAGASGTWKISKRTVTFFGRVGEEGVMTGEV